MNKLDIIYEDDGLIAINKSAGMLSIPDRFDQNLKNLKNILDKRVGKIFVVHRLDINTSGLILFAKNEFFHQSLNDQFKEREVKKSYHALCIGIPSPINMRIEARISRLPKSKSHYYVGSEGRDAITDLVVLESFRNFSLLELQPLTGRTHQIRVHLKHIGFPLLVDAKYSPNKVFFLSSIKKRMKLSAQEKPLIYRSTLHAFSLTFKHPQSNLEIQLEAPYPKDFKASLNQLRKWNSV